MARLYAATDEVEKQRIKVCYWFPAILKMFAIIISLKSYGILTPHPLRCAQHLFLPKTGPFCRLRRHFPRARGNYLKEKACARCEIGHIFCVLSKQKPPGVFSGRLQMCVCDYFISVTITAFCACRRFSASSKISSACASNTSAVISSPRCAGRQCCTMQSSCATLSSSSLT